MTGRPVRARVLVLPGAGADLSWFHVVGDSERALPVAGTATVDVSVKAPEKAPAGPFSFAVGAALEEAPDQVVSGPTVAFQLPEPKKRKFPWWILIVAVGGLLLLVGGGILIWNLTRPPRTDDGPVVFDSGFVVIAAPEIVVDLDTGEQWQRSDPSRPKASPDVLFSQGAGSGELLLRGLQEARLAEVEEPTFEACEAATGYTDDEAQTIDVLPEQDDLFVCVRSTGEGRPVVMTIAAGSGGYVVDFVTWEAGE
ncbi:hypothetical protein ACPW96_19145 [Micromonospora sp. DT81.3]|uniref:hypothetical protein n=1 Tax=Micromonospora sp. DT81.3 TaxID=3416523 RepID=UPI003CF73AE2